MKNDFLCTGQLTTLRTIIDGLLSSIMPPDSCWLHIQVSDCDKFYFLVFCVLPSKTFSIWFYCKYFPAIKFHCNNWTDPLKLNVWYALLFINWKPLHLLTVILNSRAKRMNDLVGHLLFSSLNQHTLCLRGFGF